MVFFRRPALQRFLKTHPPHRSNEPASADLLAAYEGKLPASLLELWRKKGLGFYGKWQLALIDPRIWQPVLDRWLVAPRQTLHRIPIGLTPLGTLLYYRKLTETDEDVAYIDPVSKDSGDLVWSLDMFFNDFLCDDESLDALIEGDMVKTARQECGPLAWGEVYEINQMFLTMQMFQAEKTDALDLHRRLRDAVDPPQPKDTPPETIQDAVPAAHRAEFAADAATTGDGVTGLYMSTYIDWHRMLSLTSDGRYRLLFWRIHHKTFERTEIRAYQGTYTVQRAEDGAETVSLDIRLRRDSSGSDANDSDLALMRSGGQTLLLRSDEFDDMAEAITNRGLMGRSEYYFRRVQLDQPFEEEPSDGRQAYPIDDLPPGLRARVQAEPLVTRIVHVAPINLDEEDDGCGTVMCTLDLGEEDGLRMNMPLFSPADTGRELHGWVWTMRPKACEAGIKYRRGADGEIEHGPVVGDVLTSRAPGR